MTIWSSYRSKVNLERQNAAWWLVDSCCYHGDHISHWGCQNENTVVIGWKWWHRNWVLHANWFTVVKILIYLLIGCFIFYIFLIIFLIFLLFNNFFFTWHWLMRSLTHLETRLRLGGAYRLQMTCWRVYTIPWWRLSDLNHPKGFELPP